MITPKNAWFFDVDGVITHPEEKQVTDPKIISKIGEKLKMGEPVGLITGRTIEWLDERILHFFTSRYKKNLHHFFISAEKGGVFGNFVGSKLKVNIDKTLIVPKEARKEVQEMVDKDFAQIIFFDKPKKTMISVEAKDGLTIDQFKKIQPQLDSKLKNILEKYKLEKKFKIDSVIISTDIESKKAGKDLAAKRFLDFLQQKKIRPQNFYAFGDNQSDVAMAQEVHKSGHKVTFIFSGGKKNFKGKYPFPVVFPKAMFQKGTLEYLEKQPD